LHTWTAFVGDVRRSARTAPSPVSPRGHGTGLVTGRLQTIERLEQVPLVPLVPLKSIEQRRSIIPRFPWAFPPPPNLPKLMGRTGHRDFARMFNDMPSPVRVPSPVASLEWDAISAPPVPWPGNRPVGCFVFPAVDRRSELGLERGAQLGERRKLVAAMI
jgi:hypothetical protein